MNEIWDISDSQEIDRLLRECDDTSMELPHLEANPHLLISKVRKHYLDYVIKLLSVNYEKKQKLLGKNIYLPSAIWRCAKHIELNAAQACMVVDLYRKNIIAVITLLKADTRRGKLNRQLLECLQKRPENEKNLQVNLGSNKKNCNCKCTCNGMDRKRQKLLSPAKQSNETSFSYDQNQMFNDPVKKGYSDPFDNILMSDDTQYQIPVITDTKDCPINLIPASKPTKQPPRQTMQLPQPTMQLPQPTMQLPQITMQMPHPTMQMPKQTMQSINLSQSSKVLSQRMSIESQDSEDQVMLQLEQLFRDSNDPDEDIFEGATYDGIDFGFDEQEKNKMLQESLETNNDSVEASVMDSQAAKLKSIDERLALLESAGILNTSNVANKTESKKDANESPVKERKPSHNKWLCEHYFQKRYLFEKIDEIRDSSRKKHLRLKRKFLELFGEDSDDEEDVMSPLEETPEFVLSCKERIAPWIVKLLTPYYVKGRIRGKALFKSLASHLIRLIYQCSHYPSQYEVNSFVSDFLKSHKLIRCEADFKEFRIENI